MDQLLNIGVIDVETCEPVPNVLVDIWHANATGYYGGHPRPLSGLENEVPPTTGSRKGLLTPFPKTVWGETFLRGALPTDKNGVAAFTSIFPGYYSGRATRALRIFSSLLYQTFVSYIKCPHFLFYFLPRHPRQGTHRVGDAAQ